MASDAGRLCTFLRIVQGMLTAYLNRALGERLHSATPMSCDLGDCRAALGDCRAALDDLGWLRPSSG